MKRRCHICNQVVNSPSHWKLHKDIPREKLKYDYLSFNFPKIKDLDKIRELYVNQNYSLPMLCEYVGGLDLKAMSWIVDQLGVHKRSISESNSLPSTRIKCEQTCLRKYGAKNCLSRGTKPYSKRNKTVKDKYGVDNILQCLSDLSKEHAYKQYKISKLNLRIWSLLENLKINFKSEYGISYYSDNDNKKHWKFYDFLLTDYNVIIEVNGDYWHANPELFKADDILNRPFDKDRELEKWCPKASDIWKIDEFKRQIAEVNNFKVMYIWEKELKEKTTDEIIQKIKDSINIEAVAQSECV